MLYKECCFFCIFCTASCEMWKSHLLYFWIRLCSDFSLCEKAQHWLRCCRRCRSRGPQQKKIKNEGSSGKKVKPDSTFSCHLTTQKCGDEGMWLFFFLERSLCLIAVRLFYCEFLYMMWFCTAATLTIDQVSLVKEIFWSQWDFLVKIKVK